EQGSIHAIVGGNGSGKSTMLRLIAGALKTQRGSVSNAFLKRQALLPQDPKALFVCDSVEEELLEWSNRGGYGAPEVAEALKEFGLEGLESRHPFDTSGGQQQKLALAKVLLTKPDLILLDEPTKGLDAQSKCEVAQILLKKKAEGCTIVLVTHDLSFISQIADSVSMLFDGQTACSELTSEFFHNNMFYQPVCDGFMRLWARRSADAYESGTR
ncbi:MAG: ABC transporter ATP-binding protein, partial [Raoultibacter sp.]